MRRAAPPRRSSSSSIRPSDRSNGKCFGQIPSLEGRVPPEWWKGLFNATYLKTDGDVVEDEAITRQEVDLFVDALKLRKGERVLDVCCGQGRHTLELARRGFRSEGIDASRYLIGRARRRAEEAKLRARFRLGDARQLPHGPASFEAVIVAGNSLGYSDNAEDDLILLKEARRVLRPNGRILLDIADGDHARRNFQPRSWEWIGQRQFVCRERELTEGGKRLVAREIVCDTDRGVLVDQFYSERLYAEEDLKSLLRRAGFSKIQVHANFTPESKRNQDLGLMASRIIATARASSPSVTARTEALPLRVATILGDPRLPYSVYPAGKLGEHDMALVEEMKRCLPKISEAGRRPYRFTFLNNHGTLLGDLKDLHSQGRIDFALNLCDEGFQNRLELELTIPAYLEMLGIPYSGAAPHCLATCLDKAQVRHIAVEMGIPVARGGLCHTERKAADLEIPFPVIVKPRKADGSQGIHGANVANNRRELRAAMEAVRRELGDDEAVLVEEFLPGAEYTVGLMGNADERITVLPFLEQDFSGIPQPMPKLYSYESKWVPESPYYKGIVFRRGKPSKETEARIREWSAKLFRGLECRDYARIDWRLDGDGHPRLLEVNPNPGWSSDCELAAMAGYDGMNYSKFLNRILRIVERRVLAKR